MKDITSREEYIQATSGKKTLVVFYQQWCGLCKQLISRLNLIEPNFPNGNYYGVDIETDREWYLEKARLRFLYPVTRVYENNEIIGEWHGLLYQTQFEEIINIIGGTTH